LLLLLLLLFIEYTDAFLCSATHDRRQNNSLPWNGGRTTSDVKSPNMGRSLRHQVAGRKWTSGHIHKKITTIINYHKVQLDQTRSGRFQ